MRFVLALLATGLGASAWAAPRTHDGFFLQLNLGFAQQDWSIENPGAPISELTIDGAGGQFDISIGGVVAPNVILFGQIGAAATLDPTLTAKAGSLSVMGSSDVEVVASISTMGGGVAYYLTTAGVYFSGAVLATQLEIEIDGEARGTDAGLGVQARVGKEWWVGDEWGIGVAAHYLSAAVPASGSAKGRDWDVNAFGVTLSSTFN